MKINTTYVIMGCIGLHVCFNQDWVLPIVSVITGVVYTLVFLIMGFFKRVTRWLYNGETNDIKLTHSEHHKWSEVISLAIMVGYFSYFQVWIVVGIMATTILYMELVFRPGIKRMVEAASE